mgnify:CR=1 FL=1
MEKFRLEKVLQLKKSQLRQKQVELAQLLQQKDKLHKQLQNLKDERNKYWKIEYLRCSIYQGYFETLNNKIENNKNRISELDNQIKEVQQSLLLMYQECKKYEILKEKFQAKQYIQIKRQEQKEIDEIVNNMRFCLMGYW